MSIENYSTAAVDRRGDTFETLKANRKVITIHLGGTHVECLLKSFLVKSKKVADEKGKEWYDTCGNNTGIKNPEHNLRRAFNQINELKSVATAGIERDLDYIYRPEGIRYIEYRYKEEISITTANFDKWKKCYARFVKFCMDNRWRIT